MPLIERTELATLNFKDEQAVRTTYLDAAALKSSKLFNAGIMTFSPSVVKESIQITAVNNKTGNPVNITSGFGGYLAASHPPSAGGVLYRGNMCVVVSPFVSSLNVADCKVFTNSFYWLFGSSLAGQNDCERIDRTSNFKCGDEAGFSTIFTYLRPFRKFLINSIGQTGVDWLTYDITVVATGYELNDYVQDTVEPEEIISCRVVDPNSKTLYGERPSQGEEQSDFIETQLQACRVAENIIWQQNKVIEVNFQIPFRPAIRRGQTIRVLIPAKSIDFLGIVKSFSHDFDFESAVVTTSIQATTTEYLFETASGLTNIEDKIDLRA